MEKISVRQLTREFKAIVKALPVIITVNGIDTYILKELSDNQIKEVSDKVSDNSKVSDKVKLSDKPIVSDTIKKPSKVKCQTPKTQSNPFSICPKHQVYRSSCGCK